MPFTTEQFFEVMFNYNSAVGASVWLLYLSVFFALGALFRNVSFASRLALGLLGFFWLWMGVVYHWLFFSRINPAAWVFGAFFVVQSGIFLFGTWKGWVIRFFPMKTPLGIFQMFCLAYALLIYPLIGFMMGHAYPKGPILGLPCPTTIMTFALLSGLQKPRSVVLGVALVPVLWAGIGTMAAVLFGVTEDYLLGLSAAVFLITLLSRSRYFPS